MPHDIGKLAKLTWKKFDSDNSYWYCVILADACLVDGFQNCLFSIPTGFWPSSGWLCKVYGFSSHVLPATGICQPVCPKNFVPQDVVQPDYYGWQLLSLGMAGSHFPTQRTNNNSCSIQKWIKMVIPPTWLIHLFKGEGGMQGLNVANLYTGCSWGLPMPLRGF